MARAGDDFFLRYRKSFEFVKIMAMKAFKFNIIFILFLLSGFNSFAYESPDAFIIKVFNEKVRVLSPKKFDSPMSVIIENKTQVTIKGRVTTESGSSEEFLSLQAGKSTSVKLKNVNSEKIFFVPMSPPLQRVELKLGSKPYEIPPRS